MAERGRLPRHQELPGFRDGLQPPSRRGHGPMPRHSIEEEIASRRGHGPMPRHSIEEEIAMRRDEIRRIRADNHLQVEENIALRREIAAAKEELHALAQLINKSRADKEAQARELIQKGLKLETELHGLEPVRAELVKLNSEAQKLDVQRRELLGNMQNMSKELKHLQAENQQIQTFKLEIDGLHQELVRTRATYEYEKKATSDQMEQRQVLDKNLVSMAQEVEKLRAERASMDKRGKGYGSSPGAYGDGYGGSEKRSYGSGPWSSYEHRSFPRP